MNFALEPDSNWVRQLKRATVVPACAVVPADHFVSALRTLGTARCSASSAHFTVVAAAVPVVFRRWAWQVLWSLVGRVVSSAERVAAFLGVGMVQLKVSEDSWCQ